MNAVLLVLCLFTCSCTPYVVPCDTDSECERLNPELVEVCDDCFPSE